MSVKKKLLTPAKFGLNTMKPISSDAIVRTVLGKLNKLDLTPAEKNACKSMVQNSLAGNPTFKANFFGLTGADIGVLTSDFGEVTGAIYMLNAKKGFNSVKFPTSESQRLVDYYLVKDGVDVPFSAKAGQGGAPSINALEEKLNSMDDSSLTRKQKKAKKVLKILNDESIYDGVLVAASYLKLPGYQALINIMENKKYKSGYSGGIPTVEQLMNVIDACGNYDSCIKELKHLFEAADFQLGGDAGEKKMRSVFAGTAGKRYKKWGLLHFPITSEVMSWLNNTDNGATEVLTLAARSLTVNQIYLDHVPLISGAVKWKAGELKYIIKTFSDANFKFHSPSSTPNPVGNRIGMKMIKG